MDSGTIIISIRKNLAYLDTPILISAKDGITTAEWNNYRLLGSFFMLLCGAIGYSVLGSILIISVSSLTYILTNRWLFELLPAPWSELDLLLLLALIFSVFPFTKTWPTIFSQLKSNPRKIISTQDTITYNEQGKEYMLHKAKTRVTYQASNLFGILPFKVVTFYFESDGTKLPFYKVLLSLSFVKNENYQNIHCDEFVKVMERTFGLAGKSTPSAQ
ncbi:MAG: hypothetical protein QXN37_00245 [Candidatus Anstonellaceae archaeon]